MSDFPELQHALVGAARRRYGRRAWTRRLRPLVPVTAAVAVAATAAFFLVGRPADERSATPSASEALERWYPVFRGPAGERDALPLSGQALDRFAVGPGGAQLDVSTTRLAAEDGRQRVYLVAARMLGAEAVCAALFRDGEETSTACRPIAGSHWLVAAVPADSGEPPTVFGAVPGDIDVLSVGTARGGYSTLPPIRTNGALLTTEGESPVYANWGNGYGVTQSITPPIGTEEGPWPAADCPRLQPLPASAERAAARLGRMMARSQYPEAIAIKAGPVMAQRGLGTPCGAAVAARTLTVPVRIQMSRSPYESSRRFGTILVGRIDGRMLPFTSLGR
jgi:hypothetical protein